MEHRYKIIIAYDGTHYSGWQVQLNASSIQGILQETFKRFLRHDSRLIGSGRTDAGVHALGQTAHFDSPHEIDLDRFLASANGLLPEDIRVLNIEKVDQQFHAQYDATGKIYHYHITINGQKNPFSRNYRLHIYHDFNLARVKEAIGLFLGTHDFCAFANVTEEGVASYDSIRTIRRIDLIEEPEGLRFEFEGDGFLYKMVRNMVGVLLEVAAGKRQPANISEILLSRDRRKAGQAAAAHGLFLVKVLY